MSLYRAQRVFKIVVAVLGAFFLIVIGLFLYLFLSLPSIVPQDQTFGAFWLTNFSLLIAAASFVSSALAAVWNAIEQRHLRYIENYPFLEIFPILTVDTLPLPIPKSELPVELAAFSSEYLSKVAPSHPAIPSDIDFRYLAFVLRNVGNGFISRVTISGFAKVPGYEFTETQFHIDRNFNLKPGDERPFTLLPISGLPAFHVKLTSVKYQGYFVELSDYAGHGEVIEKFPYSIPEERREVFLYDDFFDVPAGQGWVLDFWGQWRPTDYNYVIPPSASDHYMLFSGDDALFRKIFHFKGQGGAYKDLFGMLVYGQTVKITARVKAKSGTTAKVQLWCHDIEPNPKNRKTELVTPDEDWQDISMRYTATNSQNLRVHLLYTPGAGQIYVDRVMVHALHT